MLKDPINIGRADVNSYGYRDSKEQEADRYQIPLGNGGRRNVRKNARTREDAEFAAN